MPENKRRWKRVSKIRTKLNIPKSTIYWLIKNNFLLSRPGPTSRTTQVCTGYFDGKEMVLCLDTPPIDCRKCHI
jgi:hypothetical protein